MKKRMESFSVNPNPLLEGVEGLEFRVNPVHGYYGAVEMEPLDGSGVFFRLANGTVVRREEGYTSRFGVVGTEVPKAGEPHWSFGERPCGDAYPDWMRG